MSWDTSAKTGLFYVLLTSKGGNIAFPPPFPPCNIVPMFKLPIENNKLPNFEWRGQGRARILWSYPIWVQCLNNFVADYSHKMNFYTRPVSKHNKYRAEFLLMRHSNCHTCAIVNLDPELFCACRGERWKALGNLEQDCPWLVSAKNNKSVSAWSIQVWTRAVERFACLACERLFP